jgi:hypothetical protein
MCSPPSFQSCFQCSLPRLEPFYACVNFFTAGEIGAKAWTPAAWARAFWFKLVVARFEKTVLTYPVHKKMAAIRVCFPDLGWEGAIIYKLDPADICLPEQSFACKILVSGATACRHGTKIRLRADMQFFCLPRQSLLHGGPANLTALLFQAAHPSPPRLWGGLSASLLSLAEFGF